MASINSNQTSLTDEERIANAIASVIASNEGINTSTDGGTPSQSQPTVVGQKCVDEMSTTELIHLITNGVQSILLHSTNEEFRRTNFARLKVRNTADAAVVFRNQFLQLCGLKTDTSPEDIKLIQEEKENAPPIPHHSSYDHSSSRNSTHSTQLHTSDSQSQRSKSFSEPNNQEERLESPNSHFHMDGHELSPSLLNNEVVLDDKENNVLGFEEGASTSFGVFPVPYCEAGSGYLSPSLLEDVESLSGADNPNLPIQTYTRDSEINAENRVLNWLDKEVTHIQQISHFRPPFSELGNEDVSQSNTTKRQLTSECTSTRPIAKLSKNELQQVLLSKLEVLKKRKSDSQSQNISSGPSSNANTQNSPFDFGI